MGVNVMVGQAVIVGCQVCGVAVGFEVIVGFRVGKEVGLAVG